MRLFRRLQATPQFTLVGLSFLVFVLYHFGTTANYDYADDSLPFAVHTWNEPVTVVHHLMLTILYAITDFLGWGGPADFPQCLGLFKLYVAATSCLALSLVGAMSLEWFGSLRTAVLSVLGVAFTYGFWSYSIVTDLYVPAVAFCLLAIYWADHSYGGRRSRWGYGMLLLAAVSVLLAALNHQSHSLIVIPIALVLLLFRKPEIPASVRLMRAAFFLLTTGALGFVAFYGSYVWARPNGDFIRYVRGYSAWMKMMPYDNLQPLTPLYASVGIVRTIAFPECALHFQSVYREAHTHFPLKLLFDERYLLRNVPDLIICAMLVVIGILSTSLVVFFVAAVRQARTNPPRNAGFWMLTGWLPIQAVLFAWWEPSSNEFWIWLVPSLGLAVPGLVVSKHAAGRARYLPCVFVVLLFSVNYPVVSRYWRSDDSIYGVNKSYLSKVGSSDLVVSVHFYPSSALRHLQRPTPHLYEPTADRFSFDDPALQSQLVNVRRAGGRVLLDPILVMPNDTEANLIYYLYHVRSEEMDNELLKLEAYCRAARTPLYGVLRKGRDTIPFKKREFSGYLRWIEG